MTVRVQSHSRLRFADLQSDLDVEFWDLPVFKQIPEQVDDVYYQVQSTDRIDVLAYRFYGDPVLWWVIAVANGFEILPTDLKVGARIKIPSPRYVTQSLFQAAEQ